MTVPAVAAYRDLVSQIARCRAVAAQLDHPRGAGYLVAAGERGDAVAAVFDREPTLHVYLDFLSYRRPVAVVSELIRTIRTKVEIVTGNEARGVDHVRWSNGDFWQEIGELAGRLDELAGLAVLHAPQLRLDTQHGAAVMSRRLISTHQLVDAATAVRQAVAVARLVRGADPVIGRLMELADGISGVVADLREDAGFQADWWTAYFDQAHRFADADKEVGREPST